MSQGCPKMTTVGSATRCVYFSLIQTKLKPIGDKSKFFGYLYVILVKYKWICKCASFNIYENNSRPTNPTAFIRHIEFQIRDVIIPQKPKPNAISSRHDKRKGGGIMWWTTYESNYKIHIFAEYINEKINVCDYMNQNIHVYCILSTLLKLRFALYKISAL